MSAFEVFREEVTGWIRPGHDHGCKPVEVIPGLWTAHYDEIDSLEKLQEATNFAPLAMVVNSAVCQCASRDGFYGPDIKVLEIDIEDDPDERKYFDQGKKAFQSRCREPGIASKYRCAGDMTIHFDPVSDEITRSSSKAARVCWSTARHPYLVTCPHLGVFDEIPKHVVDGSWSFAQVQMGCYVALRSFCL
jgi:hypothetical protein